MHNDNNKVFPEEEEKVEIEAPPEESFPVSSSMDAGLGRSTAKSSARGNNQQGKSMPKKNYAALLQAKEAAMVRDLDGSKLLNRRPPARDPRAKSAVSRPIPSKENSISFENFHSNEMKDLQHVFHVLNIRKRSAVNLMEHNINSVQSLINTSAAELRSFSRVGARLTLGTIGDTVASRSATVFSRDDIEHIDILKKWYKWKMYQNENCIIWSKDFTRASVDEFRYDSMLTEELTHVFKELGISREVQTYLRDQGVNNVARLVAKTRQEYESLIRHQQRSTDDTAALSHRLTISDVKMIEHFKAWYSYEFVGRSLSPEWVESYDKYSKRPPSQSELDLRHVLDVLGVGPDGIEFLVKTEGIRTIPMLVSAAKDWLKDVDFDDEEMWESSQLTHKDAKQIVKFMRWYNFYVKGNRIVPKWTQDFTRTHFAEFDQYHLQPREEMSKVQRLIRSEEPTQKLFGRSQLKITAKEEKHFKEHLDNIAEKGNITPTQRYQLQKYYKKKQMIDMVQGVKYNIENGNEDTKLDEQLAMFLKEDASEEERKAGEDLMDSKQFCKWLFGAVLVIVLLGLWFYTTIYFMSKTMKLRCNDNNTTSVNETNAQEALEIFKEREQTNEKCQEVFGGYTTFIHNIVFGLVTAVVVQQLGDNSDSKSSLYGRFLPIYQRQVKKVNEMAYENGVVSWSIFRLALLQLKRISMGIVLLSTRIYILSWIGLGASSLIFGFVQNTSPANPIFTTGQAWLGISITTAYTFFGLNEQQQQQQQQQGESENGNDGSRRSAVMRADSGRRESAEPIQ